MDPVAAADELRALLQSHLQAVSNTDNRNEFIDRDLAWRLHRQIEAVLDRWDTLAVDHRKLVTRTVEYLVTTDDEEHDIRSPIGFVDDAEQVEAMLKVVAPDLLK